MWDLLVDSNLFVVVRMLLIVVTVCRWVVGLVLAVWCRVVVVTLYVLWISVRVRRMVRGSRVNCSFLGVLYIRSVPLKVLVVLRI